MASCSCCSGRDYENCCGPYLKGERWAETPEALMRARYTAYATDSLYFIKNSMLPSTQHEFDEASATSWAHDSTWLGLEVRSTTGGGEGDKTGRVEFIARYSHEGEEQEHHEVAEFKKENNKWYFVDGKMVGPETYVRAEPKIGRNDPCSCGSGKKYKKCCLVASPSKT